MFQSRVFGMVCLEPCGLTVILQCHEALSSKYHILKVKNVGVLETRGMKNSFSCVELNASENSGEEIWVAKSAQ